MKGDGCASMMEGVLCGQFASGKLAVPQGVISVGISVWLMCQLTGRSAVGIAKHVLVKLFLSLCIAPPPATLVTL